LGGNYTIGELPESAVRHLAAHEIFRSQAGRNYWAAVGQVQIEDSSGRRKQFFRILDNEYDKVMSSGIPVARPIEMGDASTEALASSVIRLKRIQQLRTLIAATVIGILAGRFWYRQKSY
jgi:hypothetical protein